MSENETITASPQVETVSGMENPPRIHWDESEMQTSYSNVCNVMGTREEMYLIFGSNQTMQPKPGGEMAIKVSNRVVMTPYAAKRLAVLLKMGLDQYEQRFGEIRI